MSGSFTSLPNNSNFSFYDKYRKDDELFGQQIFNKAAFSIWSKLGESVLNKQRVILSSSHEGKIFYAIFSMSTSMSTTSGKLTHKYSLSDYAEFNDVEQLKGHIASNKITNLCCCYSEKMPDNLDGIDVKHSIEIANADITKLSAVRPKLSLILGKGQHLQAKSAITVIVGSDQFDEPIFKELTTTWKELLGNAINGVDGVVVTLNVLFDGFGNILLQAKTSGNPKKILLSIPAETAKPAKPASLHRKGKFMEAGAVLSAFLRESTSNPNNAVTKSYNHTSSLTKVNKNSRATNQVKKILSENLYIHSEDEKQQVSHIIENIENIENEELSQLLNVINRTIKADVYYIDTCVWLYNDFWNGWENFITTVINYCKSNKHKHIVQKSVVNELNHIKDYKPDMENQARKALKYIGDYANGLSSSSHSFVDGNDHLELEPKTKGYADRAIATETAEYYSIGKKVLIISNDTGVAAEVIGRVNLTIDSLTRKHGTKYTPNQNISPFIVTSWELDYILDLKSKIEQKLKQST